MKLSVKTVGVLGALLVGTWLAVACNTVDSLGGSSGSNAAPSAGRRNAARLIDVAVNKKLTFDLVQFTGAGTQNRCDPLGVGGHQPWPSRIGGPKTFAPNLANQVSEYDWVGAIGETEYCLALRVPHEPLFPLQFSQVEFSLRAVNPWAYGHLPTQDYFMTADGSQADFPSNADNPALRSLIDLNGGDVALVVIGIDFAGAPANTLATMNFLGPTGWLVFMRDNAYQSGRFFNIAGALKGAPRALADTPSPHDDGFFESVQVNGENFDAHTEPFANTTPLPAPGVCAGAPTRPYAFVDLSNRNENFSNGPGQGGFLFVIRKEAFLGAGVVVNPNTPGPAPAPVLAGDVMPAPLSGYNELIIPEIAAPNETGNTHNGPAGVHEIGWSVFFVHSS